MMISVIVASLLILPSLADDQVGILKQAKTLTVYSFPDGNIFHLETCPKRSPKMTPGLFWESIKIKKRCDACLKTGKIKEVDYVVEIVETRKKKEPKNINAAISQMNIFDDVLLENRPF